MTLSCHPTPTPGRGHNFLMPGLTQVELRIVSAFSEAEESARDLLEILE